MDAGATAAPLTSAAAVAPIVCAASSDGQDAADVATGTASAHSSAALTTTEGQPSGSSTANSSTKSVAPPQKKGKRNGRPPKAKGVEAIEWSETMTALLMREISKEHEVLISSEQCKNKIKGLKKKWAEYCSDINSTGNELDKPIVEPTCLALMEEYWNRGTGMQGDSLADNDNISDLIDSNSDDETGDTSGGKKSKTVAERLEVGMKAMSAGYHAVASATSSQQQLQPQVQQSQPIEAHLNTVIKQLQVQNENLTSLIEVLRKQ